MRKLRPIRLEREQYEKLRVAILQRDGWQCQCCGSMTNLQVHQQEFRSHSGEDTEDNLITFDHYIGDLELVAGSCRTLDGTSAIAAIDISSAMAGMDASAVIPAMTGRDSGANTSPAITAIASSRRMMI